MEYKAWQLPNYDFRCSRFYQKVDEHKTVFWSEKGNVLNVGRHTIRWWTKYKNIRKEIYRRHICRSEVEIVWYCKLFFIPDETVFTLIISWSGQHRAPQISVTEGKNATIMSATEIYCALKKSIKLSFAISLHNYVSGKLFG